MRHLLSWTLAMALGGGILPAAAMAAEHPTDPQGFVQSATQANLAEIELGKLAQTRSTNEAVKSFAARMVADHTRANDELAALASTKSIVTNASPAAATSTAQPFAAKKGKAFDRAYADHMVHDHAAALDLFQANVSHPDGEIAAYVARTLPVLQEHRRLAENLKANLK